MIWYLFTLFSLVSLNIGYCEEATSTYQPSPEKKSPKEIRYCSSNTLFFVLKKVEEVFSNRASIKYFVFSKSEDDEEGQVQITATTEPITTKTIFHNDHPPRQIDIILKKLQEMDFVKDLKLIEADKIKYVFVKDLISPWGWEFKIIFKYLANKCK